LPSPTRAAIETNADGEWHRREGEAAMTEPIETSKAWCKSRPEREAAGPDEPTTQTGAAEASAHHRTTEASTHHPAAKASGHHPGADASAHPAAKTSTHHPAVKTATTPRRGIPRLHLRPYGHPLSTTLPSRQNPATIPRIPVLYTIVGAGKSRKFSRNFQSTAIKQH
jgi:hypothetical protein